MNDIDKKIRSLSGGEKSLTAVAMLVAIFVAFRPQWLATYSDRIYLPPRPRP